MFNILLEKYGLKELNILNKGASIEEWEQFENKISIELPIDFKELYENHNGERKNSDGIFLSFRLMTLDECFKEWELLKNSAYNIISYKPNKILEGKYQERWIPFAEDWGGSFFAVDLTPGIEGGYGQVITIDRQGDISYVIANNIKELIEKIYIAFEDGSVIIDRNCEEGIIKWKNGHFYNNVTEFVEDYKGNEEVVVDGFWKDFYKDYINKNKVPMKILLTTTNVFIKNSNDYESISLDIFKYLKNLKELVIHNESIRSFEPLKELKSLHSIVIGADNFKDSDINYLTGMNNLKQLTLTRIGLKDLSNLKGIKKLESLRINELKELNINTLRSLSYIKKLEIVGSLKDEEESNHKTLFSKLKSFIENKIIQEEYLDLDFLQEFRNLEEIEISNCRIKNLKFIEKLQQLKVIKIEKVQYGENYNLINEEVFNNFNNLKELRYAVNNFKNIENCKNLENISIDIKNYKNLDVLRTLNVRSVTVENCNSKEELKNMIRLIEKYTNLSSYSYSQNWEDD